MDDTPTKIRKVLEKVESEIQQISRQLPSDQLSRNVARIIRTAINEMNQQWPKEDRQEEKENSR